jgi:hypothetical protein
MLMNGGGMGSERGVRGEAGAEETGVRGEAGAGETGERGDGAGLVRRGLACSYWSVGARGSGVVPSWLRLLCCFNPRLVM